MARASSTERILLSEQPQSEDRAPLSLVAESETSRAAAPNPPAKARVPGGVFRVRRKGLASFLFALFRPGEARTATVDAESVKLTFGSRSREIALRDIEAVRLNAGLRWGGVGLGGGVFGVLFGAQP